MSHPTLPPAASGLVRVTVASRSRRIDLVLPGAVPVAELVPELARSVGLLDAATAYGGYHLIAPDGRRLSAETGLTLQGIVDGAVLTVGVGVDEEPPRVYDDVVEAMADAVERQSRPWSPAAGQHTALAAATATLLLGAVALVLQRGAAWGAAAAGVFAAVLLVAGLSLGRARGERSAAICLAWLAVVHAAVAGAMAMPDRSLAEPVTVALAGAGAAVVGLVALLGLGEGRSLLLPALVVGGLFGAGGLALEAWGDAPMAETFTVVAVIAVLAGSLMPWLALSASGSSVSGSSDSRNRAPGSDGDVAPEAAAPVVRARVESDARLGHELMLGVSLTVVLLLALVAPLTVSLGVPGALVVVAAAAAVMLRTRQYRARAHVLVGLAGGVVMLLVAAVAALLIHPDWGQTLAVVLAGAGAVALVGSAFPVASRLQRARIGDLAETAALVALLPLLVLALGLVG